MKQILTLSFILLLISCDEQENSKPKIEIFQGISKEVNDLLKSLKHCL